LILRWAGEANRLTRTYIVNVQPDSKSAQRPEKDFLILANLLAKGYLPVAHTAEDVILSDALADAPACFTGKLS